MSFPALKTYESITAQAVVQLWQMLRSENFKYFVKFSLIFPGVQTNYFRPGGLISRFSLQALGGSAAPADIELGSGGLRNHLEHRLPAEQGEL